MLHFKHIEPAHNVETRVPYKICSFDIEASSSHGDFPVPVKSYKKLATNIVEYFENLEQEVTIELCKKYLKQIIFNAFGLTDINDKNFKKLVEIDLVYPKKAADEGDMDPEWLNERIDELKNEMENY